MRHEESNSPYDKIAGPPPAVMSAVLDLLSLDEPGKRKVAAHILKAAVRSFEMSRAFEQTHPSNHEAFDQLRRLTDALDDATREMTAVRPDLQGMIQNLEEPPYSRDDWKGLLDGLAKLRGVVAKSKTAKLKRRLPDHQFDHAIGVLVLCLENLTGKRAKARAMDSRKSRPAELVSPEAKAIWQLLQHVDGVTENMVANRIVTLNRRFRGAALSEAYPQYAFIGGSIRLHKRSE